VLWLGKLLVWDRKERSSATDGIEETVFGSGKFDEGFDIFRTPAATACVFQAELGFDLTRHHNACSSCIADFGIGDSLAQAQIHGRLHANDDYEKHSQYVMHFRFCQESI
jgi:hypothetical protein